MTPSANFFRSNSAIGPSINTSACLPRCMQPYCRPHRRAVTSIAPFAAVSHMPGSDRLVILALLGDPPPSLHGHYSVSSVLRGSPPLVGASVLSASQGYHLGPFPLSSPARFSSSVRKPG